LTTLFKPHFQRCIIFILRKKSIAIPCSSHTMNGQ